MEITRCVSAKGKDLLIINGYSYSKKKVLKSGETFWKCSTVKSCSAKVFTISEDVVVCRSDTRHCHASNDRKMNLKILSSSAKRKAKADLSQQPSKIIHSAIKENNSVLDNTLSTNDISNVRRCIYYERKKQQGKTTLENRSTEEPSNLECLSGDLGRLLENEQLSDVRLNCGGRTFPAHRPVLAARSEVFAAMFRDKMAESNTGSVDIRDFDPDLIGLFLRYLYTGELAVESEAAAASLFAVADKYAVDSLKRACTRWIVGGLTKRNCVRYMTLADLHGGEPLKREVVAFVCDHPDVMLGKEWAEFSDKNPKLAMEVHQSFVRSKFET